MNLQDIDKFYVSDYDKFMRKFDREHPQSKSQLNEIAQHEKIANLRDNVQENDKQSDIWSDF